MHANFSLNIKVLPFSVSTFATPPPLFSASFNESSNLFLTPSLRITIKSTRSSIVCFFCFSRYIASLRSTILPSILALRKPCLLSSSISFLYSPFLPFTIGENIETFSPIPRDKTCSTIFSKF